MAHQLTNAMCRAAKPGDVLRDSIVLGFHIKVTSAGKKSFMYAFRTKAGVRRNPKLGEYPALSVEQARELARDIYAKVRAGTDPCAPQGEPSPKIDELRDRFFAEHVSIRAGKVWTRQIEVIWNRHIAP